MTYGLEWHFSQHRQKMGAHEIALNQPSPNGMQKMKNEHEETKQKSKCDMRTMLSCVTFTFDFHGLAWKAIWLACHSRNVSHFIVCWLVYCCESDAAHDSPFAYLCFWSMNFEWSFFLLKNFCLTCECNRHKQNFNVQIKNLSKKLKRFSFFSLYQQRHVYSIRVSNKIHRSWLHACVVILNEGQHYLYSWNLSAVRSW